jgi:hypothetical protein
VFAQVVLALLIGPAFPGIAAGQGIDVNNFGLGLRPIALQGAWLLNFAVPPNGFLPEQFQLLVNFTLDGGVVATSNLPTLPITPIVPFRIREGTGHGEWARTGRGKFIIELWRPSTCVGISGCVIPFPPGFLNDGDFLGWARGKAEIQVDGRTDTMQGVVELQLFAPDRQTPLGPPIPGQLAGERLRPHPIAP